MTRGDGFLLLLPALTEHVLSYPCNIPSVNAVRSVETLIFVFPSDSGPWHYIFVKVFFRNLSINITMNKQIYSFCRALFSLALLFGIVMTSCKQEILPIKVEPVTLGITSLTMSVGETMSLTATISPSDAENQKVLWSTSNANVATVKDGTVSAIAPGEATVTVKTDDGGKTSECTVTVKGANEGDGTEEDDEDENKWPIASVLGTVTATTVQFDMTLDISSMSGYQEAGLIFSPVDDLDVAAEGVTTFQLTRESYSKVFTSLNYNTTYYYTTYLKKDFFYLYGEKAEFTTSNVLLDLSVASSTATTAQITGTVEGLSESDKSLIEVGMFYSSESGKVEKGEGTKLTVTEMSSDNAFSFDLIELAYGTTYYYCSYVKQGDGYVYGEVKELVAGSVSVNLSVVSITATSAKVTGSVEGLSESDKSQIEVGMFYSSESGKVDKGEGTKLTASEIPTDNALSFNLDLTFGTKYYYCSYVKQGDRYVYGEVKEFVAGSVTVNLSAGSITATSAQITGIVEGLSESDKSLIEVGVLYSSELDKVENGQGTKLTALEIPSDNSLLFDLTGLACGTIYYYCSYVKQGDGYVYDEVKKFTTKSFVAPSGYTDLSAKSSANCYIVNQNGSYCFCVVRGNDSFDWLYQTKVSEVLWESFGTSTAPSVGDLIKSVSYDDGYIAFQTAETYKEGNAVIAAKDASGTILWSWHIWFTDQPQEQVYYNNVGTMMDRNLGATSAEPGDVGALGLLYQWGRKDPFLGSSSIDSNSVAKSTIIWPSAVSTSSSNGTVSYVIAYPTIFVSAPKTPYDWHYSSRDNTLWTKSNKTKSIYDPCPAGWRVPNGGDNGVWSKTLGSSESFADSSLYNSINECVNFSGKFGADAAIGYPASGCRNNSDGSLNNVGCSGHYWSASPDNNFAHRLYFTNDGRVDPSGRSYRASGFSVRCIKE